MSFVFGFIPLCCLTFGIYIANHKEKDLVLNFNEIFFFVVTLPPLVFYSGRLSNFHLIKRNWRIVLLRGILFPLASFAIISIGAFFFLPVLGLNSIAARDCLGSLFASNNFLFCFEEIQMGKGNFHPIHQIAIVESVFNTATSCLLFKLIHSMDVMSLQPSTFVYLFFQFLYQVVASTFLGIAMAYTIKVFAVLDNTLVHPNIDFSAEGALRMTEKLHIAATHCLLYASSFDIHLIATRLKLNSILMIFPYALLTSHHLLPQEARYRVSPRYKIPLWIYLFDAPLYGWLGACVADSDHWGFVFSSRTNFGTYLAAVSLLLILIIIGRVPSMLHFSQSVINKVENVGEIRNVYLLGIWRISSTELENKIIIWWSGFMPSIFAAALALEQFDKSKEPVHAYMLTSICSVVYLTSVVFCICMASSLKQRLGRLMISAHEHNE